MTILFNTRRVRSSARDYLRGASSIFNISGDTTREYNLARTASEADENALASDWDAVGQDLESAVNEQTPSRV